MSQGENSLDLAAKRLESALHVLEQRLSQKLREAGDGGAFDQDRAKLAAELDQALHRDGDFLRIACGQF